LIKVVSEDERAKKQALVRCAEDIFGKNGIEIA
jgi:hypothetical protein